MNTSKSIRIAAAALLATGLLVAAPSAQAISFDFTIDHVTGGAGVPPFGSVTLVQNGTSVDVTVHLNSPNQFVKTGSADFQDFKFNATGVTLGDITVDAGLAAATGSFNGDGTGSFAFGINNPSQGSGGSDPFSFDIVFHVADALIADLTAPNADGYIFVADILGSTGNTGPVAAITTNPNTPTTPDGGTTLMLLGASFAALSATRRFIKR